MMALEDALLGILVCPADKGSLLYFPDDAVLYNPRLRRLYRIEDGIPVMLADKSVPVSDEDHDRLMARAEHATATASAELAPGRDPRLRRHGKIRTLRKNGARSGARSSARPASSTPRRPAVRPGARYERFAAG